MLHSEFLLSDCVSALFISPLEVSHVIPVLMHDLFLFVPFDRVLFILSPNSSIFLFDLTCGPGYLLFPSLLSCSRL